MDYLKQIGLKNCIKYLIFAGVTYAILKLVPTKPLTDMETSILITIILLGIFSLDCLTISKTKENMANNKIMDLDLDVDLDFNKSSNKLLEKNTQVKPKIDKTESPV